MRISNLTLFTNKLKEEQSFYSSDLGFELIEENRDSFTVQIGWSRLTFRFSPNSHRYHYCFMIPPNQLDEAMRWMEQRVEILEIETGRKVQRFESWNAKSFYFYDASGNLAEFIARYDLKEHEAEGEFSQSQVLCVNEIGIPTADVRATNTSFEHQFGTKFWKGDFQRFGTNGSQEGLFLLPNYHVKKTWFPTEMNVTVEPLEVTFQNGENNFVLKVTEGQIRG